MRNFLINGDCLEVMKKIKSNSIDLCVTDPPYKITNCGNTGKSGGIFNSKNNEYIKSGKVFKYNEIKFNEWLPEVYRVLKDRTHFYMFVNDKNLLSALTEGKKAGFKLHNILVWEKNTHTPNKFYLKNCEFIIFFRKGKERYINKMGTKTILKFNNIRKKEKIHPTEKPKELLKVLVENSSNEGDLILDLFSGSGSLGQACKETNRNYILIEKDKEYFDLSKKRIKIHKN